MFSPKALAIEALRGSSAALRVAFARFFEAFLVTYIPLITVVLALGTFVADILRGLPRYLSELSAFHDALLPAIACGLLYILPDVLEVLYNVTRRFGTAVVRGTFTVATILNAKAVVIARVAFVGAVVLSWTMDVPFLQGVRKLFLLGLAVTNLSSMAWNSPATGGLFWGCRMTVVRLTVLSIIATLALWTLPLDTTYLVKSLRFWIAVATAILVLLKVTQTSSSSTTTTTTTATAKATNSAAKLHRLNIY